MGISRDLNLPFCFSQNLTSTDKELRYSCVGDEEKSFFARFVPQQTFLRSGRCYFGTKGFLWLNSVCVNKRNLSISFLMFLKTFSIPVNFPIHAI